MKISEIYDTHEDEFTGLNFRLGDIEAESNEHKEVKTKSIYLVETIKIPERDVLSYKDDNEKIITSQEQKNNIHTNFL